MKKNTNPKLSGERKLDCYVGIKPCGCMVAWVHDTPGDLKIVAKSVADLITRGYAVERANTEEVRYKLGRCKCANTFAERSSLR